MNISSLKRRMKAATATVTALATAAVLATVPSATANAATTVEVPLTFTCNQGIGSFTKTYRVTAPAEVALGDQFKVSVEPDQMAVSAPSWNMGYGIQAETPGKTAVLEEATVDTSTMKGLTGSPQANRSGVGILQYTFQIKDPKFNLFRPYGLMGDGVYKHPTVNLTFTANKAGDVTIKTGGALTSALWWQSSPLVVLCNTEPKELAKIKVLEEGEKPQPKPTIVDFVEGAPQLPAEGGEADLSVRVLTAEGNPVTEGKVVFRVDGDSKEVEVPVSSDGKATWKKNFPANTTEEEQMKLVHAKFTGTDSFAPNENTVMVLVAGKAPESGGGTTGGGTGGTEETTKVATSVKAKATQQALIAGSATVGYELSATVTATNGGNIGGGKVVFTENGETLASAIVDQDGKGSVLIPLKAKSSHTVTATFQKLTRGTTEYTESETSIKIDVPATPEPSSGGGDTATPAPELKTASLSVDADSTSVAVGESTTVTATYAPSAGKKEGQTVVFRVDGVKVSDGVTDASGKATTDIPIATSGSHKITAVVAQQQAGKITVASVESDPVVVSTSQSTEESTSTTLKVLPSGKVGLGTPITMTAEVSGAADGDSWVSFYDGDKLLGDVKVEGGKASFTFTPSDEGSHDLKATFNGAIVGTKDLQASESATTPVTVAKDSTRKSFTVEAPKAAEGPAGGKEGSSLGAAKTPLIIVGVLTGILFIAGIIFLIPDVRKMANLPPIPPLFPVPNMG